MANNAQLKAAISNVIKTNGTQAITGYVLQSVLLSIVSNLGQNYQFVGIATTETNPGTPDQNVFYLAGEGVYTNFSNLTIDAGQLGVLRWNGTWSKQVLEIGSSGGNAILEWNTDVATTRKEVLSKYRKPGLQISYEEPDNGWINEQYIGTSITDTEWVRDLNWEKTPNQKQIQELLTYINASNSCLSLNPDFITYLNFENFGSRFVSGIYYKDTPKGCTSNVINLNKKGFTIAPLLNPLEGYQLSTQCYVRKDGGNWEVINYFVSTDNKYPAFKIPDGYDELVFNFNTRQSEEYPIQNISLKYFSVTPDVFNKYNKVATIKDIEGLLALQNIFEKEGVKKTIEQEKASLCTNMQSPGAFFYINLNKYITDNNHKLKIKTIFQLDNDCTYDLMAYGTGHSEYFKLIENVNLNGVNNIIIPDGVSNIRRLRIDLSPNNVGTVYGHAYSFFEVYNEEPLTWYDNIAEKLNEQNSFKGKRLSVMGDSISTYRGFLTPERCAWYYSDEGTNGTPSEPNGNPYESNVRDVSNMYWHKLCTKLGMVLDTVNAFSGSSICKTENGAYPNPANAFIADDRITNIGKPDVLIIYGGTNDAWLSADIGTAKYSDWTDDDLKTFKPALAYLIYNIQRRHPGVELYFFIGTALITKDTETEYAKAIKEVCEHYNIKTMDGSQLYSVYDAKGNHPTIMGQEEILSAIVEAWGYNYIDL